MELILTSCVAILGGYVGIKLRIPAGALIGAMIATAIFNIAFELAYMPAQLKFFTQVATGAYIGAKVSKTDIQQIKNILKPALLLLGVMLTFAVGVGWLICRISDLAISTALFAMAPAGISDMTLASMDFNADPSVVALIQTLRVLFTISFFPVIIKWIGKQNNAHAYKETKSTRPPEKNSKKSWSNLVLTLLSGVIFGGVGKALGIPGGTITFSMVGCAALNISTRCGYMSLNLRRFIQMFAGALIGSTIGRPQIIQIIELPIVVAIAVISFILVDIVAAIVMIKVFKMDIITALFACAPGGVTDMALIAEEMGADSLKVAGMHTIRLVGIIALYPVVIQGALPLLN